MIEFTQIETRIANVPETWVAVAYPWTFVVTAIIDGKYAASAKDATSFAPSEKLGTHFIALVDAQEACRAFHRRQRQ